MLNNDLAELDVADPQTHTVFAYFCDFADSADLALVLGHVTRSAQWTLDDRFAPTTH